tara:strand:+ start:66 stop:191 length:126 start_codon:yes stop_codon:yes gene_type:complete
MVTISKIQKETLLLRASREKHITFSFIEYDFYRCPLEELSK